MTRPIPLSLNTRWLDAKGRTWRIVEKMPFGRNFCVLADHPSYSGEWTTAEIRAALASGRVAPLVEALEMVRDADNDAKADGLAGQLPVAARSKIDAALAQVGGAA